MFLLNLCVFLVGISSLSIMPGSNLAMLTSMPVASPGLSHLSPMTGLTPYAPATAGLSPLMASASTRPMMPTVGNNALSNGTIGFLQPVPAGPMTTGKSPVALKISLKLLSNMQVLRFSIKLTPFKRFLQSCFY